MTLIPEFGFVPREADEGLFSRDIDGQLVRLDAATESQYDNPVTVFVDGRPVELPIAEPLKDAQGNDVLDTAGCTTPRYTTILDAVAAFNDDRRKHNEKEVSIPTLCHQSHLTPVAVCRLCMVQVKKAGVAERRLLPACQHLVKDGKGAMEVFTMDAPGDEGARVRQAVRVMTELLMADHLKSPQDPVFNELQQMANRFELSDSRFALDVLAAGPSPAPIAGPPVGHRLLDSSSPVFLVDHSACILCERCIRSCNDVKNNHVIGRTGKGRTAGIAFDLNVPMFDSSCVQCGECMVSCPTSAITFKPTGAVRSQAGRKIEAVSLEEMKQDPLFDGIPFKFLLWQKDLVVRRRLKRGDILCRQGDPGNSAFIIKRGRLEIVQRGGGTVPPRTVDDVIVGEMACLSGSPRNAGIIALDDDGEVWEVRRNVLDRMMRSLNQRGKFQQLYRERALANVLPASELFLNLPADEYARCIRFLQPKLTFVRVEPGQTILRQGDLADCFYLIRLGHVRVGIYRHGEEATFLNRGPGTVIGEMGLLSISAEDIGQPVEEVCNALRSRLADRNTRGFVTGRRTATCTALDHVELARVDGEVFLDMAQQFPAFLRNVVKMALSRAGERPLPHMRKFIEQGLYQGQSLLVLDLTKCTRCDECTRACERQHGEASHGHEITRLLREGLHFGDFLVATACRSCKDAYCMIGCPVDAIHRGKHLQIVIEDHCIGCGLCARNCPYGNIFMQPNTLAIMPAGGDDRSGAVRLVAQQKAATCDLCDAEGRRDHPQPSCVYACPHDAAHRMTGEELLNQVERQYGES